MPPIRKKEEQNNLETPKQVQSKLSVDFKRIGTATKLSRLQKSIISENKDVRMKYLNSIMIYIPVINHFK